MRLSLIALTLATCLQAQAQEAQMISLSKTPSAPQAAQRTHQNTWHGQTYEDPYFWMRQKDSPEILAHLKAENAYTEEMTAHLKPFQEKLYKEMLGRMEETDMSVSVRKGAFHTYTRIEKGQQYVVHCRKAALPSGEMDPKAPEEVVLDLNELAKQHAFVHIRNFEISDDGQKLLYTLDTSGYRQYSLFIKDLKTRETRGPLAERVTSAEWAKDNQTFYYVTEDAVSKRADTLWRQTLQKKLEKCVEEKDPTFALKVSRTKDGQFILCQSQSTDTSEVRVLESDQAQAPFRLILAREKGHRYDIEHHDGHFFIRSNKGAVNFRLVKAPVKDPQFNNWKNVLAHQPKTLLEDVHVFKNHLVVQELHEGITQFRVHDFKQKGWKPLHFDEKVYALSAHENPDYHASHFRFNFSSLITPQKVMEFDLKNQTLRMLKEKKVHGGYDPSSLKVDRLWATARDGAKIPISIVYKKNFKRDGNGPLWLYAYGSYGYGTFPEFDLNNLALLERGVAFAIAHVRGGNEMGEAWHLNGMLMKKKNTFYDFIDCAQFLISQKWTKKERLAIEGGSAGGLLVGAVLNEKPDLCQAAHAAVPFMDVVNSMMDQSLPLTTVEYLEWGNPNDKKAFDYMLSYSPYDNLKKTAYPAMLVSTSYNDSQVMYWEPAKYVAKLRTLKTDTNPLLLKCIMEPAGHGGASGRYNSIRNRAFEYAFLLSQLGIKE